MSSGSEFLSCGAKQLKLVMDGETAFLNEYVLAEEILTWKSIIITGNTMKQDI